MLIVPEADSLIVEAKVTPQDIDQVQLRPARRPALPRLQPAHHAGDQRRGDAHLGRPDPTEQRTGLAYYTIRIALPEDEVSRLGEVALVPGMPVEAFVQTGDRTVMSYLVKPFEDHFNRAFREK